MTLVFECFDTVRFQVQEMARAEKIISDEAIQVELDIYNRLLPAPGELSATVFIELTSDEALREWLPRLVGIERQLGIAIDGEVVPSVPEAEHAAALTRETVTPAVHYVRFGFTEAQVGGLRRRRARWLWWRPIPPTRPGQSCHPGCAVSSSGICLAQQRPFQSADQGQFRAQVFTGAQDVRHTLRSPNLVLPPRVVRPKGPPNRANQVSAFSTVIEEVFPMIATTWRKQAACRGLDVEAFYPVTEDEADAAEAKAVCAVCPVRQACLEHALAHREREGIWGGTTERERRRIVRQRRKSA